MKINNRQTREDQKMTNTKKLNEIIKHSGFKKKYLAEQIGRTPYGLALKIDGTNEFTAQEIKKLCEILSITDPNEIMDIFLNN